MSDDPIQRFTRVFPGTTIVAARTKPRSTPDIAKARARISLLVPNERTLLLASPSAWGADGARSRPPHGHRPISTLAAETGCAPLSWTDRIEGVALARGPVLAIGVPAMRILWPRYSPQDESGAYGHWMLFQGKHFVMGVPDPDYIRDGGRDRKAMIKHWWEAVGDYVGRKLAVADPLWQIGTTCVICGARAVGADERFHGWCDRHSKHVRAGLPGDMMYEPEVRVHKGGVISVADSLYEYGEEPF